MLVVDENSVYEIDETCVRKRGVAPECGIFEKLSTISNQEHYVEESERLTEKQSNLQI